MKFMICCVRDRAVDSFGTPIFVQGLGQAIRSFSDEINKSGGGQADMFAAHPEDFDLYELGSFDGDTGLFETSNPRQIAIGKDMVRKP